MARRKVMGKATRMATKEEIRKIFNLCLNGFTKEDGTEFRANKRLHDILYVQCYLGLRIGDVLSLSKRHIVGNRLIIVEGKTGKLLNKRIPNKSLEYIKSLIRNDEPIFQIGERAVQKNLKIICDHLGLKNISTHSFRKAYATMLYEVRHDIEVVRQALNHASIETTQRYIGVSGREIDNTIDSIDIDEDEKAC